MTTAPETRHCHNCWNLLAYCTCHPTTSSPPEPYDQNQDDDEETPMAWMDRWFAGLFGYRPRPVPPRPKGQPVALGNRCQCGQQTIIPGAGRHPICFNCDRRACGCGKHDAIGRTITCECGARLIPLTPIGVEAEVAEILKLTPADFQPPPALAAA